MNEPSLSPLLVPQDVTKHRFFTNPRKPTAAKRNSEWKIFRRTKVFICKNLQWSHWKNTHYSERGIKRGLFLSELVFSVDVQLSIIPEECSLLT